MTAVLGRTIAIGDIHGCSLALKALLDAIDPCPEDLGRDRRRAGR
jgi:hypothetical protein